VCRRGRGGERASRRNRPATREPLVRSAITRPIASRKRLFLGEARGKRLARLRRRKSWLISAVMKRVLLARRGAPSSLSLSLSPRKLAFLPYGNRHGWQIRSSGSSSWRAIASSGEEVRDLHLRVQTCVCFNDVSATRHDLFQIITHERIARNFLVSRGTRRTRRREARCGAGVLRDFVC